MLKLSNGLLDKRPLFYSFLHTVSSCGHGINVKFKLNYISGEAFKTLSVYQRCLEKERKRWIKHGRKMDVNVVTTISKSLRKIYAITKQNMDLLDKAVVQSFIESFPNDSTKIALGNAGLKMLEGKKSQVRVKGGSKKLPKDRFATSKKKVKEHELSNDL